MKFSNNIRNINIERQLVAGLKNGDAACFESLVRDYGGRMLAVARRYIHNGADAQDCVQEAYLQAFRNIHQFKGQSSIATWLHRIVVNAALMKIRANKRRPEEYIDDDEEALFNASGERIERETEVSLSVEDVLIDEDARGEVRRCINQLPEFSRQLVLLRDIEGNSKVETARLLEVTISNVKTGLHRARKALRQRIEQTVDIKYQNLSAKYENNFINHSRSYQS
ncbi:MAG: sigma-70 family RNA polymerase sigma factor [Methylococcales bacterium]|nr:sigma-70 family RNA polymerase sigma factor [Methylococcales bacterium]